MDVFGYIFDNFGNSDKKYFPNIRTFLLFMNIPIHLQTFSRKEERTTRVYLHLCLLLLLENFLFLFSKSLKFFLKNTLVSTLLKT